MRPSRSVYRTQSAAGPAGAASLATAAVLAALAGCQPAPKPAPMPAPAPPMTTTNDTNRVSRQLAAIDPNARVGHVASVSAADHLAAVGGIPFADVKAGDPISFVGPDNQPFATGTIQDLDDRTNAQFPLLIVDYQKASAGGRDPGVGDSAVTIPMGR